MTEVAVNPAVNPESVCLGRVLDEGTSTERHFQRRNELLPILAFFFSSQSFYPLMLLYDFIAVVVVVKMTLLRT